MVQFDDLIDSTLEEGDVYAPLMVAVKAEKPDLECIKLLLESGALDAPNWNGQTAVELAVSKKLFVIADPIKEYTKLALKHQK